MKKTINGFEYDTCKDISLTVLIIKEPGNNKKHIELKALVPSDRDTERDFARKTGGFYLHIYYEIGGHITPLSAEKAKEWLLDNLTPERIAEVALAQLNVRALNKK